VLGNTNDDVFMRRFHKYESYFRRMSRKHAKKGKVGMSDLISECLLLMVEMMDMSDDDFDRVIKHRAFLRIMGVVRRGCHWSIPFNMHGQRAYLHSLENFSDYLVYRADEDKNSDLCDLCHYVEETLSDGMSKRLWMMYRNDMLDEVIASRNDRQGTNRSAITIQAISDYTGISLHNIRKHLNIIKLAILDVVGRERVERILGAKLQINSRGHVVTLREKHRKSQDSVHEKPSDVQQYRVEGVQDRCG
jgi:hypothetical protein